MTPKKKRPSWPRSRCWTASQHFSELIWTVFVWDDMPTVCLIRRAATIRNLRSNLFHRAHEVRGIVGAARAFVARHLRIGAQGSSPNCFTRRIGVDFVLRRNDLVRRAAA